MSYNTSSNINSKYLTIDYRIFPAHGNIIIITMVATLPRGLRQEYATPFLCITEDRDKE